MSEAIDDMDAYIQLTDEVFQRILHYTEPDDKLEKVFNFMVPICLQIDMHIKFDHRLVVSCIEYKHGSCTSASLMSPVMIGKRCLPYNILVSMLKIFNCWLCLNGVGCLGPCSNRSTNSWQNGSTRNRAAWQHSCPGKLELLVDVYWYTIHVHVCYILDQILLYCRWCCWVMEWTLTILCCSIRRRI